MNWPSRARNAALPSSQAASISPAPNAGSVFGQFFKSVSLALGLEPFAGTYHPARIR